MNTRSRLLIITFLTLIMAGLYTLKRTSSVQASFGNRLFDINPFNNVAFQGSNQLHNILQEPTAPPGGEDWMLIQFSTDTPTPTNTPGATIVRFQVDFATDTPRPTNTPVPTDTPPPTTTISPTNIYDPTHTSRPGSSITPTKTRTPPPPLPPPDQPPIVDPLIPSSSGSCVFALVLLISVGVITLIIGKSITGFSAGPQVSSLDRGAILVTADDRNIPLGQTFMIGSGAACQLRLRDNIVSSQHARITYSQGRWYLRDLNSAYGTFVNGRRVQNQYLRTGDLISIGKSTFVFVIR